MMPTMSGRNGRNVSNSNVNKLLAAARRAVAESRAREENLQAALEKALAEKVDLEKASADSLRKEKSELESSLREEKAALERSLLDKCKKLQVNVDSLERKYASECRSRISIEKALNKFKKKAEEEARLEKAKKEEEEEQKNKRFAFGMKKETSRNIDTSAIIEKESFVNKNRSSFKKVRFGF